MPEKQHKFSIIFEGLDKLSEQPEIRLEDDELDEYEEIEFLEKSF